MKLYTIAWQNRPLVCLENRPGRLTPLPYETMNHLLADRPDHRAGVLEKAGKGSGEFALAEVQVLAPIPHPRQDVICLGMNYQKHGLAPRPSPGRRPRRSTFPSGPPTAPAPAPPSPATLAWWTAWIMRRSWR